MAAAAAAGGTPLALAVRLKPNPFVQYLAIKPHDQIKGGVHTGAALFVSGLPHGFDEDALADLFSCFGGTVAQAVLHKTKRSGMVVFSAEAARAEVLKQAARGQVVEYALQEDEDAPAGVKAWVQAHKAARPGNEVMQQQIDEWMERHDAQEEARAKARQAAMAEDGWTVVVRAKGRKRTREEDGVTVQTGGAAGAAAAAAAAAAAKKGDDDKGQLVDFYRFQRREKRRNELADLRERFEEDRKRIAHLKAVRNFKPY